MHKRSVLGEEVPACSAFMPHTIFALCSSPFMLKNLLILWRVRG
jgi:hypothetical protein